MGKGNYLIGILIAYPIAVGIVAGIMHSWISFFEYGWQWNETTMPPLVYWNIYWRVLPVSLLVGIPVTPVVLLIAIIFIHAWNNF